MPILYNGHFNERENDVDYKSTKIAIYDEMTFIELEQSIIGSLDSICNFAPPQLFVSVGSKDLIKKWLGH